jgi:Resolvase, N terminal domain
LVRCRRACGQPQYIDYESGRKAADKRKQFAALFDDAAKRKFDCVLFWALDRFSREGMAQTIIHLQRLSSYDIAFHSYTEPHLATDNELVRNVLLALLSSLAKVEAQKISERTKAMKRGMGWVDLKMTLGWPRCAPVERPLQMLATVGSKSKSVGRSSPGSAACRGRHWPRRNHRYPSVDFAHAYRDAHFHLGKDYMSALH